MIAILCGLFLTMPITIADDRVYVMDRLTKPE